VPEPTRLYTWWRYRSPDWTKSDKGRRLDHIWTSDMLADRVAAVTVAKDYRRAARPSDHVPVSATLQL
jgi:exodeoxyribonuclease-3